MLGLGLPLAGAADAALSHPLTGVVAGVVLTVVLAALREWRRSQKADDIADALSRDLLARLVHEVGELREMVDKLDRETLRDVAERLAGIDATVSLLLSYHDPSNPRQSPG